jgi:ribose transport system substrate-binding protein
VLAVNTPDFPWLDSVGKGFTETVQAGCAACKVTKLDIGIPDLGSGAIIDQTVSALRSDPSINYIAGIDAEFFLALPAAMQAAGISNSVKLFGCCSAKASQTGLSDGSFVAVTGVNGNYAGFITLDAAMRFAEGSPVPSNEGDLPLGLLLPDTKLTPSNSYDEPSDFVNQFKALWHLS